MHYYQFNISDYKAHTCHLTPMEDLAYRRLIDFYYLHEKPIGFDIDQIARKIQMQEYKTEIENVLNEFFEQDENGFFQKRVEEEIQKFHGYITKQSENGRKGGRPPSQDKNPPLLNKKPKPNPVDMKTETQKKPKQEPLTTNQEPLNNNQEQINNICVYIPPESDPTQNFEIHPVRATLKPMTDDWQPSESTLAKVQINWPYKQAGIKKEIEKFKLHYQGTGAIKADWDKIFELWLTKSIDFESKNKPESPPVKEKEPMNKRFERLKLAEKVYWKTKNKWLKKQDIDWPENFSIPPRLLSTGEDIDIKHLETEPKLMSKTNG